MVERRVAVRISRVAIRHPDATFLRLALTTDREFPATSIPLPQEITQKTIRIIPGISGYSELMYFCVRFAGQELVRRTETMSSFTFP